MAAKHPSIAGIKDPVGAAETVLDHFDGSRKVGDHDVCCAPDHLVHNRLQKSCSGVVSGPGNMAPQVLAAIPRRFNSGIAAAGDTAQEVFGGLRKGLYTPGFFPAMVKPALYMKDPSVGLSRQPALMPDAVQDATILQSHNLI